MREELRQSQKLTALGEILGGAAHDFNNLLAPIIGSLDLLARHGTRDARELQLIDRALQSAERAKTLVQRLLAFAHRQPLQPRAIDVAALIVDMTDLIGTTTGPSIRLMFEVEPNLPLAKVDPQQVEMAILNLVVNARDAMPDGGTLTVSAHCDAVASDHPTKLPPGRYIRLSIADTGTGMDEATIAQAAEPFFSTKGVGKGTGLGLSMVHGLLSQLGGALVLSSKPGCGTTAELLFPVSAETVERVEPKEAFAANGKAAGRVLVVDDEPLVRMNTTDMLIELGYEVVEAGSAEEALVILDGEPHIDGLITDHVMPGMTGVDLAEAVRAKRPGTPVLLISGLGEADGIAIGLPLLTKPFRQSHLAASLAALLQQAAK